MLQSLTPSYLFVIFPLKTTFPLKKPINFLNFKKVCNEIYAVSLNYLKWTTYHSRQSSRVRVICVKSKVQLLKSFWQICMRNVKCDDSNASENIHHKLHKQLDKFVSSNQIRSVLQRKMWLQHGISNSNENELLSGFLSSCSDETFSDLKKLSSIGRLCN